LKDSREEMNLRRWRGSGNPSGLPVNLWLNDSPAYTSEKHAEKVKVQEDYGNNVYDHIQRNLQIPENHLPKIKLSAKDINAVRVF
jgi:hypothetical protein